MASSPVLKHPLLRLLVGTAALILVAIAVQAAAGPLGKSGPATGVVAVALTLSVAITYWVFVHFIERRPVSELAPRFAGRELSGGLLLGFVLFSLVIGTIAALGDYVITGRNAATVMVPAFAGAVAAGIVEELLVRGMIFRLLEEWLGTWIALAVSALLFGVMHFFNPHAGVVPAVAVALEAGVLLAAAYVLTRRLWFSIGLHVSWNFTQAGVFGVAVSGHEVKGVLRSSLRGPALISGGSFGAEASIFAVIFCLAAAVIMLRLAVRAGHIITRGIAA